MINSLAHINNQTDPMLNHKADIHQNKSLIIVLVLILLTISVYWPVQHYGFLHYDDDVYVTENKYTQSGVTQQSLGWALTTKYFGLWNPLTWLSLMLDYEAFGLNAGGYHWTNVLMHIANAILLFFLLKQITGAVWRSACVAALFAIHPINVESVVWISERKNVLSTFFWMMTMLCYVWYVRSPGWKRYLPVFVCFLLGLMSKPMLVTLPFVLLLVDFWPLNRVSLSPEHNISCHGLAAVRKEKISFLFREKIPLFALSAFSIFITLFSFSDRETHYFRSPDVTQRIGNAIFSYAMYVKKMFWPADLSIFYLYLDVSVWQILLSALLLALITFFVCKFFKKYPYLPFGWFWYLGTLLPVTGIFLIGDHTMADRYAYVPFIGLFVIMVWGAEEIFSKSIASRRILTAVFIAMIGLFTLATYHRIGIWESTQTLFEDVIRKNPRHYFAYQIVGQELAQKGDKQRALFFYDMSIKSSPRFWSAYNNKGLILKDIGRREEALEHFQQAMRMNPFSADAPYNIGLFYLEDRKYDHSIQYALKAIEKDPLYEKAYNILGIAFVEQGRVNEGILQFEKALQIDPGNKTIQQNLQIALEKRNQKKMPSH